GFGGDVKCGTLSYSAHVELRGRCRRAILPYPGRYGAGEGGFLQGIDELTLSRTLEPQLIDGTAANLGQEAVQFEFNRLGRKNVLQHSLIAAEHSQQRQISVVTHGEDISSRTTRLRKFLPLLGIPGRESAAVNGTARGFAVAQQ